MRSTQAQGVPNAQAAPLRPELSAEHGVTLVETLLSAVILVVVVFAVLATLDTASSTTAANRARTVAAALAEQDQERLRAMRSVDLSNLTEVRDVPQGGVTYRVESRSEWVSDATGGADSCSSAGGRADYMKITSTVTSAAAGRRIQPVRISSVVAPRVGAFGPGQGTLAVQVKNELDAPVAGMPVQVTGPSVHQRATNQQGCAVFGRIPVGTYTATLSQPGWVDKGGNQTVGKTASVTEGTIATASFQYALGAAVTVTFDTSVGSRQEPETSPAISAANPGMPGGKKVVPASGGKAGSITATGLFPFPDGYSFYSGACDTSAPGNDYYASHPGFVRIGAGGSASVTVREPALNLRITDGPNEHSASPFAQAYVVITAQGCTDRYVFDGLRPNGTLPEPGLPFGTYTICADDRNIRADDADARHVIHSGVVSTDPGGLPLLHNGEPQLRLRIDHDASAPGACA